VQIHGLVPVGGALRRDTARSGDLIYVTGTLGDAALSLQILQQRLQCSVADAGYLQRRLERPEPRVMESVSLRGVASAVIDISDGLVADLGHILEASGVGATLYIDRLPLSDALCACRQADSSGHGPDWWDALALGGGDDYELCFTVPSDRQAMLGMRSSETSCPWTRVGVVETLKGLRCVGRDGRPVVPRQCGFEHFSAEIDLETQQRHDPDDG
jgi:thiamine-monophosphate kinase